MVLSKHELTTRIRSCICHLDRGMHCESEVVDLDQIKRNLVIEFEFGVLAGYF